MASSMDTSNLPHDNRGPQLSAVCITFLIMAVLSVCMRAYVRIKMLKAWGIEDYFMVAGLLGFIMFVTAALCGITYGTGRHAWDLTPASMRQAFRYWWVCYLGYASTMIAVKMSVGLLLLRLTVNRIHHRILYVVMALSAFTGAIFLFLTVFQCSPVSFFWDRVVSTDGHCLDINIIMGLTYAYSVINTITDFTFGLLPIALVHDLQVDRKTKFMIVPILGMACIASSAIIVRMAYVREFADPDFLYATTDIAIWSTVEQGLAITAGSLATLRPLFRLVSQKLGFSSGTTSNGAATPGHSQAMSPGLATPRKRLSRPMGIVSFRSNESTDDYHRMDDFDTVSRTSRTQLASKAHENAFETGQWSPRRMGDVEQGSSDGESERGGRGKVMQIEKKIEIETRSDPAYQ